MNDPMEFLEPVTPEGVNSNLLLQVADFRVPSHDEDAGQKAQLCTGMYLPFD